MQSNWFRKLWLLPLVAIALPVLAFQTAADPLTVLRTRRRFWRQSYIGGIVTRRDGETTPVRQTGGIDVTLSTPMFLRKQVLEVSGFYLNTTKLSGTRGGAAFGGRINLPNDPVNARISVREVQDGYDPAVGFVDRRGYRLIDPALRYTVHIKNNRVVRRFSLETDVNSIYDLNGVLETRTADFQLIRVELQSADFLEFHLRPLHERLPRNFQIFSSIVLPAGSEYDFLRRRFQIQSAARRAVSINATYEDGEFYSGDRRQINGTVSVRPHRGWLINIGADYNHVTLKEGRFITRVWSNDINTQFNPFVSLVNRIQYDTVTRQLGWQSRFRWIMSPGNDLYLVYSHNWIDDISFHSLDRKGTIKIVKTVRF